MLDSRPPEHPRDGEQIPVHGPESEQITVELTGGEYVELERRAATQDQETTTVAADILGDHLNETTRAPEAIHFRFGTVISVLSFWSIAALWLLNTLHHPILPPAPFTIESAIPRIAAVAICAYAVASIGYVFGLPSAEALENDSRRKP